MVSSFTAWHARSGILNGSDNADISAAAAQIAAHVLADVGHRRRVAFPNAGNRRHDLSGRAIPALKGVVVDKRLLHHVQGAGRSGEPFYGCQLTSIGLERERQT